MKFRSERSRKFLRNFEALASDDFAEDPVPEDFTVPEVFTARAGQEAATDQVATLLEQIRDGRFVVLNFSATQEVVNGVLDRDMGGRVVRRVAGQPQINIEMTLIPGPNNDPDDDDYPPAGRKDMGRQPAGADPVRLLIFDDE